MIRGDKERGSDSMALLQVLCCNLRLVQKEQTLDSKEAHRALMDQASSTLLQFLSLPTREVSIT